MIGLPSGVDVQGINLCLLSSTQSCIIPVHSEQPETWEFQPQQQEFNFFGGQCDISILKDWVCPNEGGCSTCIIMTLGGTELESSLGKHICWVLIAWGEPVKMHFKFSSFTILPSMAVLKVVFKFCAHKPQNINRGNEWHQISSSGVWSIHCL